jgi:hypothetical protein
MKQDIIDGRDERLADLVDESHASTLPYANYEHSEGNCDPLQWIEPLSYRQKIHHFICARRSLIAAVLDPGGKQPDNQLTKGKNRCYKCGVAFHALRRSSALIGQQRMQCMHRALISCSTRCTPSISFFRFRQRVSTIGS